MNENLDPGMNGLPTPDQVRPDLSIEIMKARIKLGVTLKKAEGKPFLWPIDFYSPHKEVGTLMLKELHKAGWSWRLVWNATDEEDFYEIRPAVITLEASS